MGEDSEEGGVSGPHDDHGPLLLALPRSLEMRTMAQQRSKITMAIVFGCILRDSHFWVPLIVLIGGLLLLAWVS
jgi:hypothetical protein